MGVKLFKENDTPYGKSLQEWSNRWWSWMVGQPEGTNPTRDSSGQNANNCQFYDDVYFLCGTTETEKVHRKCTIPEGKSILVPVICYEHSLLEDDKIVNPNELLKLSSDDLKGYDYYAEINDEDYSNEIIRIKSPLFRLTLPKNNVWHTREGYTVAAADGYWIFVNDPQSGTYKVKASSKEHPLNIDTTYEVTIS
ncbi:MAG: hypothetical protein WBX01_03015 [Nitrososphaeraceae archaeon]